MAALEIYVDTYQGLRYDLQAEIDKYTAALNAFKTTVDEPAPATTGLVENIVKNFGGEFVIIPIPINPPPPQPLPTDSAYYRSPDEQAAMIAIEEAKNAPLPEPKPYQ
jgi:hypothetical protein